MKKILLIIAAASMMMTACSKEEVKTEGGKKGMTMTAAVQEDSKATLDQDGSKYHFTWETNDKVYVYNPSSTEYGFTNNGTSFVNEEAMPEAGNWVATYPDKRSDDIYFAYQDGTLASLAKIFPIHGTTTASADQTKLEFAMEPVCAVLKITTTEPLSSVILTVDSDNPFEGILRYNTIYNANSYDKGYTLDDDCVGNKTQGLFYQYEGDPSLPAGTHYFLIPAGDGVIADYTPDTPGATKGFFLWINGDQMNTAPKTFTAGKVYTLNYPNI